MQGFFAIVLAAGASTRMGRCKAGLPWVHHQSLLAYQTAQILAAELTPVVVLGTHNAERAVDCLQGSVVVINPSPERGKVSSIQTGLRALPEAWEGVMILAVDQPRPAAVYRRLLQRYAEKRSPITVPVFGDRLGHPALFDQTLRPELENLSEESQGLRAVVRSYDWTLDRVWFDHPAVLQDLNTPEEYAIALSQFEIL